MDKNKRAEFTALINELVAMVKGEGVKVIEQGLDEDTAVILLVNAKKEALKNVITNFGKILKSGIATGDVKWYHYYIYREFFKYLNDQFTIALPLRTFFKIEPAGFDVNDDEELFRVLKTIFSSALVGAWYNIDIDKDTITDFVFFASYKLLKIYSLFNKIMGELKGMVEDLRKEVQALVDPQELIVSKEHLNQPFLLIKERQFLDGIGAPNVCAINLKGQIQSKVY
jgi:hypothetical protein